MILPAENIQAPRIMDPDTARPCTVLGTGTNGAGIRYLILQEDPENGKSTRNGQRKPYTVTITSLWYLR